MKKSVMIRVVCLVVAAFVLSGALMVAALSGSPYETLKESVLDAMMLRNGVVKAEMTYSVDGVVQETSKSEGAYTENASYVKLFDEDGTEYGFIYNADDLYLRTDYVAPDGTQWYYGWLRDEDSYRHSGYTVSVVGIIDEETRNSASMRFIELAIDALVGDLKNNITMTTVDGTRRISGTLTGSQIPELARAGLDMLVEQGSGYQSSENTVAIDLDAGTRTYEQIIINGTEKHVYTYEQTFQPMTDVTWEQLNSGPYYGQYYGNFYYPTTPVPGGGYELNENSKGYMILSESMVSERTSAATRADYAGVDPMNMPLRSVDVSYVHGEADVDENGNLTRASANGTMTVTNAFGETFTLDVQFDLNITDIGSATVPSPVMGAEQALTRDFLKDKLSTDGTYHDYMGFYFKLNPDGSVDKSSVTTTWPGEHDVTADAYTREHVFEAADVEAIEPVPEPVPENETDGVVIPDDGENG